MRTIAAASLILLCCHHLAALSYGSDLRRVANSKDPYAVGTAFRSWMESGTWERKDLTLAAKVLLREDLAGHQSLQAAALADKTEDLVDALLDAGGVGSRVAALILATDAAIQRCHLDRLPPEPPAGTASTSPDGTPRSTPPQLAKASDDQRARQIEQLLKLLTIKDDLTRDAALIAAAHYGYQEDKLAAAIEAYEPDGGSQPGARLLYLAISGKTMTVEDIEEAFNCRRRQPKAITKANNELSIANVLVPSAALAAEAIGLGGDESHLPFLHAALGVKDIRVQVEAALACGRIGDPESAGPLVAVLKKSPWPVFVYATDAIARCPNTTAIPLMVPMLKKMDGRFRQHLLFAISACAGNQYGRTTYDQWMDWWEKEGKDIVVDRGEAMKFLTRYTPQKVSVETDAAFYDLPVISSRLAFVVDRSGSMGTDKMEELRSNLATCIPDLAKGSLMNIIAYDDEVEWWSKGLSADRRSALGYAKKLTSRGGTNIYDPSHMSIMLNSVDSVYLMTDGSPGSGQFTDWVDITASMTFLLRYRPIAVHTVAVQAGSSTAAAMEQLALMNHGTHLSL